MKFISITPENMSQYNKIVKDQSMDAFVKLYSPNCGHCQAMQKDWDALENVPELKKLNIAIIEVRHDALDDIDNETTKKIEGFPTIRVIKNSKIVGEYDGDRSTADMTKFILENFSPKIKLSGGSKINKIYKRKKTSIRKNKTNNRKHNIKNSKTRKTNIKKYKTRKHF